MIHKKKNLLKNLLKWNFDSETCPNYSIFPIFSITNLKNIFNKFFNKFCFLVYHAPGYLVVFQIYNITPFGGYWTLILASLEWGQAPKPPSFVALRATTQSTRWSLIQHWWQPKNKREWRYVEFSSGDSSIFTQKLERISKNLGGNPSWASPTRDCPLGFWIFSLVFSWIFCNPPSLTSTYCYNT